MSRNTRDKIVPILATIVTAATFNGWVLSVMWNWFIPNIFDLPKLSVIEAIGLWLVVAATQSFTAYDDKEKNPWRRFLVFLLGTVIRGLLLLAMGFVFYMF